jgi:hypothetical protein
LGEKFDNVIGRPIGQTTDQRASISFEGSRYHHQNGIVFNFRFLHEMVVDSDGRRMISGSASNRVGVLMSAIQYVYTFLT